MMQSKDLRIGNYYSDGNNFRQITANDILELFESDRIWINSIPLTEEILLKVDGLVKPSQYFEGYAMFSIKVEVGYLTISKKDNDDFYVLNTGYVKVKIKHVHQLQNLYFSLTGQELELKV